MEMERLVAMTWPTGRMVSVLAAALRTAHGDADDDNDVDGADFLIWQRQLGSKLAIQLAVSVPEPSNITLAVGAYSGPLSQTACDEYFKTFAALHSS